MHGMAEVDVLELGSEWRDRSDSEHRLPTQIVIVEIEEVTGGVVVDPHVGAADRTAQIQAQRGHDVVVCDSGC